MLSHSACGQDPVPLPEFESFALLQRGTGSYWLINADIGSDIISKQGKKLFSVYVTGTNLTDIAYQNFLSRLRYEAVNNVTNRVGVFDVGRNFLFKVNVPFDFKLK